MATSIAAQIYTPLTDAAWSDARVLSRIQELTVPLLEGSGAIEAWILDDTGFPKKGRHSVGVARQYCGQLGKRDNCQVAVSLSLANHAASLPIAWRLYLPLEWTADAARRAAAGVPETVRFLTKPEIALEQIRAACAAGLPRGVVLRGSFHNHRRLSCSVRRIVVRVPMSGASDKDSSIGFSATQSY